MKDNGFRQIKVLSLDRPDHALRPAGGAASFTAHYC